ncbi:MAG: XTP/dITP diphosphatase [Chloroflexi bacterium]|nr:XTP/dITP diphosphatase [Chloroflexota bacterium]
MKLLVATNNTGKLREFATLLASLDVEILSPASLGLALRVEETGSTFADNAVLKAKSYAAASGLWTLADDSGLEVDALHGEPGTHSARYLGPYASDADRNRHLLANLKGVPRRKRTARFRCAIAIASPNGETEVVEETCEGLISLAPAGMHGFGYDPIFYLPQFRRTMAQLPLNLKNSISHRAKASQLARPIIERLCGANP